MHKVNSHVFMSVTSEMSLVAMRNAVMLAIAPATKARRNLIATTVNSSFMCEGLIVYKDSSSALTLRTTGSQFRQMCSGSEAE